MSRRLVANARTRIDAPVAVVWEALVNPDAIRKYMFDAVVVSEWREGSPIRWKGVWRGKPYEDKGEILELKPQRLLSYSHFAPLSGLPDVPDSYHTVSIELSRDGDGTAVSLSQDNNPTEEARGHSEENWGAMLGGLKRLLEGGRQKE